MKWLLVCGLCFAVASLVAGRRDDRDRVDQDDRRDRDRDRDDADVLRKYKNHGSLAVSYNPGSSPKMSHQQLGSRVYDLGSLSFRYYAPYYYGVSQDLSGGGSSGHSSAGVEAGKNNRGKNPYFFGHGGSKVLDSKVEEYGPYGYDYSYHPSRLNIFGHGLQGLSQVSYLREDQDRNDVREDQWDDE